MSFKKLFASTEDFSLSIAKAIEIIKGPLCTEVPLPEDLDSMKALLALFMTATLQLDPNAFNDPQLDQKVSIVRLGLLAAYNLGRERGHTAKQQSNCSGPDSTTV